MGKRANTQGAVKVAKQAKVDPVLASITSVLMEAENLPEHCRTMLVETLPFSLSVPLEERHEIQTSVVNMVADFLNSKKSAMESAVVTEETTLAELNGSYVKLMRKLQEAVEAVSTQKNVVQVTKSTLGEATSTTNDSWIALSDLRTEHKASDAKMAQDQAEKAALEAAVDAHLKPLKEGVEGPHFKGLEPYVRNLNIDASLHSALPTTCAKLKEERGSFDVVVIEELEKAFAAKIAALAESVAVAQSASLERQAVVQTSEQDYESKMAKQKHAAGELEAALQEETRREGDLTKAKQTKEELQSQIGDTTGLLDGAKQALEAFEADAYAGFTTYRSASKVVPVIPAETIAAEAAPAGA